MKIKTLSFFLLLGGLSMFWLACNKGEGRDALLTEIKTLEEKLSKQTGEMNKDEALQLIGLQEKFASTFPADSAAHMMFFNASGVAHGIRDYQKSIDLLDRFIKENPKHERAPLAMLTQGLVLEQDLHKNEQAKAKYDAVVRQYPNSQAAMQAQQLLSVLGIDPNELVKKFEAARDTSDAEAK